MSDTVQTAVVGVTGYAGAELARLLLRHPRLKGKPPVFAGRVDERDAARGGVPLAEIHPELVDSTGHGLLGRSLFPGICWPAAASRFCFSPRPTSSRGSGFPRLSGAACA
jgi:hypothetical protein